MTDLTNLTKEELAENTYWGELYQSLERLKKNDDFKKVITEGFMKELAERNVSLLADERTKQEGRRPDVIELLVAISHLNYFFFTIENMGAPADEYSVERLNEE